LRREDGWLTLVGLHWLEEGNNTVGSDPMCHVALPVAGDPDVLGVINFHEGKATLTANEPVLVDDVFTTVAVLRDDQAEGGPSLVRIGAVTFFVIKRGDQYAVRVRDANNPERQAFTGRKWFAIDPSYQVQATFTAHVPARTIN